MNEVQQSAKSRFANEFDGLEVKEFPVHSDGKGFYVQWDDGNPRATFPRTEALIVWPDGEEVRTEIESKKEFELWTVHLNH